MINDLRHYLSQLIDVSDEEMNEFQRMEVIASYSKDTVLLREGEVSNKSYFVLKGCLRVYYLVDGEERTTAFYTERQAITPQCVVDGKPSAYHLVCVEDSVLVAATPEMENHFFTKFPKFETLCRVMAEKMLAVNQLSFDKYMISSPEERYLHLLETNKDLVNRVPQYHLASYIGIKPESLSRIRKRLAKK
ncbi:MAG TPA: Crp/Fnr family transcriptional regulator [Chryseosolibacter sp.]|nr:Crp/Fnr family transcriptional regulator [Chryseosolibacter sp.]